MHHFANEEFKVIFEQTEENKFSARVLQLEEPVNIDREIVRSVPSARLLQRRVELARQSQVFVPRPQCAKSDVRSEPAALLASDRPGVEYEESQ